MTQYFVYCLSFRGSFSRKTSAALHQMIQNRTVMTSIIGRCLGNSPSRRLLCTASGPSRTQETFHGIILMSFVFWNNPVSSDATNQIGEDNIYSWLVRCVTYRTVLPLVQHITLPVHSRPLDLLIPHSNLWWINCQILSVFITPQFQMSAETAYLRGMG